MGLCASNQGNLSPAEKAALEAEKAKSRKIEGEMRADRMKDTQIHKLLLLGAGESGKSTLFKQMMSIYSKGYEKDEQRIGFKTVICNNVLSSMKTLCEQSEILSTADMTACHPDLEPSRRYIVQLKVMDSIDPNLGAHIKALWRDPGIRRTYELRNRFQLTDSAKYFLDELDEIVKPDFIPTLQDILRTRVRTTGIVENELEIEGNKFKIFDVGGQRNERKKWIHCFSEVTAVLFVAALSEYDMVLFEDETTNRMDEALKLFEEICNSNWFQRTSMILFLNKRDLFMEKLQNVPLTVWAPDYEGGNSYEAAIAYISERFQSLKKNKQKTLYVHVTCATDSNMMATVFNAVKDIVIRQSLQEGGLLN